jgi:hypothetical protein
MSEPVTNYRKLICFFFMAPILFWCPDIVVHTASPSFGGAEVAMLTLALPFLTCGVLFTVVRLGFQTWWATSCCLVGLLGIWVTGPVMMMVGWSSTEGGFAGEGAAELAVMGTLLFPLFCFSMSTYDGTLVALLITTMLLGVVPIAIRLAPEYRSSEAPRCIDPQFQPGNDRANS